MSSSSGKSFIVLDILAGAVLLAVPFNGCARQDLPEGHALDGYDIMPFLKGEIPSPRKEFLYSQGSGFEALREGPWKYRVAGGEDHAELFHLDRDPAEMFNVIGRYPEVAKELHDKLVNYALRYGSDY